MISRFMKQLTNPSFCERERFYTQSKKRTC